MDFGSKLLPTDRRLCFTEDGYYVWCGSMFRYRRIYYLAYSRWKRELGFEAWVTDSEICLAKSDAVDGRFSYIKTIRTKDGGGRWDSSCAHNPTVLEADGRFYLYYMGNDGDDWWGCRNRQRIGVMSCSDPEGDWTYGNTPLMDVSPGCFDGLMVSNPTVTKTPDGKFLMLYKAVSEKGELPRGGDVVLGAAIADTPDGVFRKYGKPIMVNPTNGWSVEDPFVWYDDGRFYALVKDFHGYFTGTPSSATALFVSDDGFDWQPDGISLAYPRVLTFDENGAQVQISVHRLERPQLYFENGRARMLLCACAVDPSYRDVYNVRIPLQ